MTCLPTFWSSVLLTVISVGLLQRCLAHRRRAEVALREVGVMLREVQNAIHEQDRYTRGDGGGPAR